MSLKIRISNFLYLHSFWWRNYLDNKIDRFAARKGFAELSNGGRNEPSDCVIVLFNSKEALYNIRHNSGGLIDRLKGIVAVYKACKLTNRPFRICHTDPFDLERYLCPNTVDWHIISSDVCYDANKTDVHVFSYVYRKNEEEWKDEEEYQWRRLLKLINKAKRSHKELHIYTNALLMKNILDEFRSLFSELFRPSDILKSEIDKNLQAIGSPYISVSFRFTHLLGDPVDVIREELDESGKQALIHRMGEELENIHKKHPNNKLLVNTDSNIFREYVKGLSLQYVYMTPGIPVHIDQTKDASDVSIMKTFLDFFMISNAERVLLVKDQKMYNSNFPRYAAAIGKKPFKLIEV